MTSLSASRRVSANRRNAQRSTGPRTAEGKRRTAQNAAKHGLSVPLSADPGVSAQIARLAEELVRQISDEGARQVSVPVMEPETHQAAREMVEAQLDLLRIREIRRTHQESLVGLVDLEGLASARPHVPSEREARLLQRFASLAEKHKTSQNRALKNSAKQDATLQDSAGSKPSGTSFPTIRWPSAQDIEQAYAQQAVIQTLAQLQKLDRYERRALSRRKKAGRALSLVLGLIGTCKVA